ncbi:MAG: alpha/beta hydrolase fold protein [Mycobacterium sp.]|nr:alpha/beta hydrolase fold protein [Mycobacterium sp.]
MISRVSERSGPIISRVSISRVSISRVSRAAASSRRLVAGGPAPAMLRATARELGWVAAHVVLYPTGIRADPRLKWPATDEPPAPSTAGGAPDPQTTPILLLHGLVDNRSVFTRLRNSLAREGFGCLLSLNYPVLTGDIPTAAHNLADVVDRICERTGFERLHIVGHSMGGLIARYHVQRLAGDRRVDTLVTLATPHHGTASARLVPYGIVRQLRPGSPGVAELMEPAPGCRTRIVSIYSDRDTLVPAASAHLEHADLDVRNVLVPGAGHHTLPFDRRTVAEISKTLRHLDSTGIPVKRVRSRDSA